MKSFHSLLPILLVLCQSGFSQSLPTTPGISGIVIVCDTIFVATFDDGIIRSTDFGASWSAASSGIPTNQMWCIASDGATALAGTEQGIFRSTDGGDSWGASNSGLTDLNIYALYVRDSIALAKTYAGLFRSTDGGSSWNSVPGHEGNRFAEADDAIYFSTQAGVYRSIDRGANWTELSQGNAPDISNGVALRDSNIFVAKGGGGVQFSPDRGATWQARGLDSTVSTYSTYSVFANATHVFASTSGEGMFVSSDLCSTWTQSNDGLKNLFLDQIAGTDSVVFVGSNAGMYRSLDNGASWELIRFGSGVGKVEAFLEHEGVLFAGTDGGVFRLESDSVWVPKDSGLTRSWVSSLAALGPSLFVGIREAGVYRSADMGDHWTKSSNGLTDTIVESMATRDSVLFAGTNFAGVYRSLDSGATWTPTASIGVPHQSILSLLVWNEMIFAGHGGGVALTTDDGESWTDRSSGFIFGYIQGIARLGDTLFACSGSGGGIYRSTDSAQHWVEVDSGLANWFVNTLAVGGQSVYAGTMEGLYVSTNGGVSWALFDSSLNGTIVHSIVALDDELVIGTQQGIRRLAYSPTTSVAQADAAIPQSFELLHNYPNPFNAMTNIRYRLPKAERVRLTVHDLLGREVARLVEAHQWPGEHMVTFDASGLSSGMYVFLLTGSGERMTRRMVLLK